MMLRLCRMLAALWWGAMAGMAFLAVPVIFMTAPEKSLAGAIAARVFDLHAFWVMGGAVLLLLVARVDALCRARHLEWALLLAAAAAAANHWGIAPLIVSARATGGNLALWHGVGSALVAFCFVMSAWVNWRLSSRQSLFS